MTVDCMACLVAISRGLPEGGVYQDAGGVTHATMRSRHSTFITCTVCRDSRNSYRIIKGQFII